MCTIGLRILGVAASVAYPTTLKPQWIALARDANASSIGASYRCVLIIWSSRWRAHRRPGWEKGRVEKQVQDLRRVLFTPQRSFEHLEECNQWLSDQCIHHAKTHAHPEFPQRKIFEVFESEREFLIPYAGAFDGFRSSQVRVSKTCLVRFDNNSYSVSAQVAGQIVEVYGYAERVVIRKDGEVVGEHKRLFGKGNTAYDAWHYLPVLTRKPGALRNGAPFRNWALPEPVQRVRERLSGYDDGDRQMVKILCAAMHHGLDAGDCGMF